MIPNKENQQEVDAQSGPRQFELEALLGVMTMAAGGKVPRHLFEPTQRIMKYMLPREALDGTADDGLNAEIVFLKLTSLPFNKIIFDALGKLEGIGIAEDGDEHLHGKDTLKIKEDIQRYLPLGKPAMIQATKISEKEYYDLVLQVNDLMNKAEHGEESGMPSGNDSSVSAGKKAYGATRKVYPPYFTPQAVIGLELIAQEKEIYCEEIFARAGLDLMAYVLPPGVMHDLDVPMSDKARIALKVVQSDERNFDIKKLKLLDDLAAIRIEDGSPIDSPAAEKLRAVINMKFKDLCHSEFYVENTIGMQDYESMLGQLRLKRGEIAPMNVRTLSRPKESHVSRLNREHTPPYFGFDAVIGLALLSQDKVTDANRRLIEPAKALIRYVLRPEVVNAENVPLEQMAAVTLLALAQDGRNFDIKPLVEAIEVEQIRNNKGEYDVKANGHLKGVVNGLLNNYQQSYVIAPHGISPARYEQLKNKLDKSVKEKSEAASKKDPDALRVGIHAEGFGLLPEVEGNPEASLAIRAIYSLAKLNVSSVDRRQFSLIEGTHVLRIDVPSTQIHMMENILKDFDIKAENNMAVVKTRASVYGDNKFVRPRKHRALLINLDQVVNSPNFPTLSMLEGAEHRVVHIRKDRTSDLENAPYRGF